MNIWAQTDIFEGAWGVSNGQNASPRIVHFHNINNCHDSFGVGAPSGDLEFEVQGPTWVIYDPCGTL